MTHLPAASGGRAHTAAISTVSGTVAGRTPETVPESRSGTATRQHARAGATATEEPDPSIRQT